MIVIVFCLVLGFVLCLLVKRYREHYLKQKRHWEKYSAIFHGRWKISSEEFEEAITKALLGDDYYIVDPVRNEQGNLIEYYDIIEKYLKKYDWWKPIDKRVIDD